MPNKISSNITGLAIAKEASLKVLPGSPKWYAQEPNSYPDTGGDIKTVSRSPINASRQNKKGTIVDLDASGGFNIDVTKSNLTRLMQGFMFAAAREKPTTVSLTNDTPVAITAVDAVGDEYQAAAGLGAFNKAGYLIYVSGFGVAANNGLKTVVSADATGVIVAEGLTAEAAPPAAARLDVVGYEFDAAECAITVTGGIPSLTATTTDLTTLGLTPGEWVFLGGDEVGSKFTNNVGYARVSTIAAGAVSFDDTTWTPAAEAGAGITLKLFFGTVIRNEEDPDLIVTSSYQIERQLGQGATDTQAEYLVGSVANEFTLNIPQADKLNADLSFVSLDTEYRTGDAGDEIKGGTRVAALGETAINTSNDVYRIKMHIHDDTASNPAALFGYVTEASISIKNGVTPDKAVAVLGAFDVSTGNFEASGQVTAYFSTVEAIQAIRNNADVGISAIVAANNAGLVYDIPLTGLGGGRANVVKDKAITVPLTASGAENDNGYTMLHTAFAYLPDVAMP